jgi:hypothetical protein
MTGCMQHVAERAQTCHELHTSIMSSVALGLGIGERFFADQINEQYHNLR